MKKYVVKLSETERTELLEMVSKGSHRATTIRRAYTLLKSDEGKTDEEIGAMLYVDTDTVRLTRMRYCDGGLVAALQDQPGRGNQPKMDEQQEAYLVALTCSDPPAGQERWTLDLLATQLKADGIADVSSETVRLRLQKKGLNPGR